SAVSWDGSQLVARPAEVQCETKTTPVAVTVRRNRLLPGTRGGLVDQIVEGVAMRRVQERMPVAERESSELTESKISARMDARVEKLIELANTQSEEFIHKPFIRSGLHSELGISKRGDYLSINLKQMDAAG